MPQHPGVEECPLRVLHVARTVNPKYGGPSHWLEETCRIRAEQGQIIEVLTSDGPDEDCVRDFPVKVHGLGPTDHFYGHAPGMKAWLQENLRHYDAVVLHAVWQYPALAAGEELIGKGIPYFIIPHGMFDSYFHQGWNLKVIKKVVYWHLKLKRVVKNCSAILWTNKGAFQEGAKMYKVAPNDRVIRYGTNFPSFDAKESKDAFAQYAPDLVGKKFVMFLGRIDPIKNLLSLVEGFAQAFPNESEIQLLLAGPTDLPYAAELRAKSRELGIADRVHMPGLITGPAKAGGLAACWTFACPSHLESFGMAVAEGLSYGKPVLISDKVKIRLEIQETSAGVISTTQPSSIAEKLREMESWSESEYQTRCINAKNCYQTKFTADGSAEDVTRFILDALGKKA